MVVTGETSGDMHAARVIREIKNIEPDINVYGMGSDCLRNEGVDILIDPTDISTIGFVEAFKNLTKHLGNLKLLKDSIDRENPDVIFLVDNSAFNMVMARIACKKGVPAVNYFSPSAWVWGEWRARWMARYNAVIASVFPMEAEVYEKSGADVVFVGHPLLDMVKIDKSYDEIYEEFDLNPEYRVIGLLPGSRKQEIDTLLPEMLKAAERLQENYPEYQFVLPVAGGIDCEIIREKATKYNLLIKIVQGKSYEVMKISDLLIAASGTATLEAAIIGTPVVIVYQVSQFSYTLGKRLIKTEYIGLPNIIAGREIVPELLQDKANEDEIYLNVISILNKPDEINDIKQELNQVEKKLGSPGAVRRTAELVLKRGGLI